MPEVTVLMSVFNGESYLSSAIESILSQTFTNFEFIIIDDFSIDNSLSILEEFILQDSRITLIRNEKNIGLTHSLNKGLKKAEGKFIARQDADDISEPNRLEEQVKFLKQNPSAVIVGTAAYLINKDHEIIGEEHRPIDDTSIRWRNLFSTSFIHTSVMLRTSVLRDQGIIYDEKITFAQDYKMWSQLLLKGTGYNIDKLLVRRRIHNDQIGSVYGKQQDRSSSNTCRENLLELGIDVSLQETKTLRRLFANPRSFKIRDLRLYFMLFKILQALKKQDDIDVTTVKRINNQLLGDTLRLPYYFLHTRYWEFSRKFRRLRANAQKDIAAMKRRRWQKKANPSGKSIPCFLFGCQRSGTNMTIRGLSQSQYVDLYNEDNRKAFRNCELLDSKTITNLIDISYGQVVLFKPIMETHQANRLLETFPNTRALFIFRYFDDVVNSIKRARLVPGTVEEKFDLFLCHTSPETQEIVRQLGLKARNIDSHYALFWYIQNSFYFDLRLNENSSVKLIRYESIVKDPEKHFREICNFVELEYLPEMIQNIRMSSLGKHAPPLIEPDIRSACLNLYERMQNAIN